MTKRDQKTQLWPELEREAQRMVLDLLEMGQPVDDCERIAMRVLTAHPDVSATMREDYVDELVETVRKHVDLLAEKMRP